jgi:hypothetical protein
LYINFYVLLFSALADVPAAEKNRGDVPAKEKRHAFPRMSVIHPTPIRTL